MSSNDLRNSKLEFTPAFGTQPQQLKVISDFEENMKSVAAYLIALLSFNLIGAFVVPVSESPVLSEDNLISDFQRIDPEDFSSETLPTKAWLWKDEYRLFVHFEAVIDENFETGIPSMRDEQSDKSDYLRVQLLTMPEQHFAYYFLAFPNSTLQDGTRNPDLSVDYRWDSTYSYESSYTNDLWTLTMSIPLGELRFTGKPPHKWKIILGRYNSKSGDLFSMPPLITSLGKDYFLLAQDITLQEPIQKKLNLQYKPYFVKAYDLMQRSSTFDPDNLGYWHRQVVHLNTRIKMSINPDFSDVPPDDASDIYNQKYQSKYAENRFFFIEDLDVFQWQDVLYTRSIIQPRIAFKATGVSQSIKWGILSALDRQIEEAGTIINHDDFLHAFVIRPTIDNLKLGTGLVSRLNNKYSNHVLCFDANLEFAKDWSLDSRYRHSLRDDDRVSSTGSTNGYNGKISLMYTPKQWDILAYYQRVSKEYQADAGYSMNTDYHCLYGIARWDSGTRDRYLRQSNAALYAGIYTYNLDADVHPDEYDLGVTLFADFCPKYDITFASYLNQLLDYQQDEHQTFGTSLSATYKAWNWLNFYYRLAVGKALVYSLYDTHFLQSSELSIWGNLSSNFSYTIAFSLRQYDYPKNNTIVQGNDQYTVILDDRYLIANTSLNFNPNLKTQISIGCSMDSYEYSSYNIYGWGQFFGNLRYELLPKSFLYLGFNTRQSKQSDFYHPFEDFRKDSATAYLKLSLTI